MDEDGRSPGEDVGRGSRLTRRQREITALVARGLTNRQIADELVLSRGSVANRVREIFLTLGLPTRSRLAAWAVEHGLASSQDRHLSVLERLLELEPKDLRGAMTQAVNLLAETLDADKVDAFIYLPSSHTLVAAGTSETPMGRHQKALGLDRLPIANGGLAVRVFETGESYLDNRADRNSAELIGIRRALGVKASMGVPLTVGGLKRGVLSVAAGSPDAFTPRDLRFLTAAARWVGVVAHRAELLGRSQTEVHELVASHDPRGE